MILLLLYAESIFRISRMVFSASEFGSSNSDGGPAPKTTPIQASQEKSSWRFSGSGLSFQPRIFVAKLRIKESRLG